MGIPGSAVSLAIERESETIDGRQTLSIVEIFAETMEISGPALDLVIEVKVCGIGVNIRRTLDVRDLV